MKGELYKHHLNFVEEAKRAFETDYKLFTYRNKDDDLIALRYGEDHDCINVFELGEQKAFLHNIMKKCPVETIRKQEENGKLYLGVNLNGGEMLEEVEHLFDQFISKYGIAANTVHLGKKQVNTLSEWNRKIEKLYDMKVVYLEDEDRISVGLTV